VSWHELARRAPCVGDAESSRIRCAEHVATDHTRLRGEVGGRDSVGELAAQVVLKTCHQRARVGMAQHVAQCIVQESFAAEPPRIGHELQLTISVIAVAGWFRAVHA